MSVSTIPQGIDDEFPGYVEAYAMPIEPAMMDEASLDEMLLWATKIGASDIHLMTKDSVIISIHGHNARITKKKLTSYDLEALTNIFYRGANGVSHIRSAGEIDCSYWIRHEAAGTRCGFRVNVTGCRAMHGAPGIQITLRTINGTPPRFSDLGVEQEIIDAFDPENGFVGVCGRTGSGKSTLLAASIRAKLEDGNNTRKIITGESPIEYVYDEIPRGADMIVQHEIPRDIKTYDQFVRNCLRRAPSDILVGESRDYPTISAALEAAETGHALYTTVHANSVSEAFYRILNMFPPGERSSKLFEVVEAMRMLVVQKLVPTPDGKRTGLREYLVFDEGIRDRICHAQSMKDAVAVVKTLVDTKGQSMLKAAWAAHGKGLLTIQDVGKFEDHNMVDDFSTEF